MMINVGKIAAVCAMLAPAAVYGMGDAVLDGLMERVSPGLSNKVVVELCGDTIDYYELSQQGERPLVRANNRVSAAYGLHRYLRDYAGLHLCWNDMYGRELPEVLPEVTTPQRRVTELPMRYYLNYCTHSYSMAFWDTARWRQEVDWMALHGINMPLMASGMERVWYSTLERLGYTPEEVAGFVAGPGFQAWWLMNNLEGWGGPVSRDYMERRGEVAAEALGFMRELDMEPVLPGYSGMLPHDAGQRLGVNVQDPGLWLAFVRPSFLQPADSSFARVADIYYDELTRYMGTSRYYSMDPFHEGGIVEGVDLPAAGRELVAAMKRVRDDAVWVVQAWQANPRRAMIENLQPEDVVVLDLRAECLPQCGDTLSAWYRPEGFGSHKHLWCMLHNFGGNVGMYGKLRHVAEAVGKARNETDGTLGGIGLTMEGIENNPVVYELMCDVAWEAPGMDVEQWLRKYLWSRYGGKDPDEHVWDAWMLLLRSVYGCPGSNRQQGTTESVFCIRPTDNPVKSSTWLVPEPYYDGADVVTAARHMAAAADRFAGNSNFVYDLVDVTRQALNECGRMEARRFGEAAAKGDSASYRKAAERFMTLLDMDDRLLGSLSDFRVGSWLEAARATGVTDDEKNLAEWNARVLVTVWGPREAAETGGLRDYSQREWQGLLADFYARRWRAWFDARLASWGSEELPEIDFYAIDREWADSHNRYSGASEGDAVALVREAIALMER